MRQSLCITEIQKWWRNYTSITKLRDVYNHLSSLSDDDLQELSNKCHAITQSFKGDGAGLSGGTLIDMFLSNFLKQKLTKYSESHDGESDMKICGLPLSQKKINGKSTIALDWSKNEKKSQRERFACDIIIINLKTEKWWKKNPNKTIAKPKNIIYNDTIPAGIYIIDKKFCKYYVKLSSNNKTDTLIESQYLYMMLNRSISQNLFIGLPTPNQELKFNISNAF